jgi:hypothetical protein
VTSSRDRIVAPSFVIVISPTLSTSILSRLYQVAFSASPTVDDSLITHPTGPSDDLRMFDTV